MNRIEIYTELGELHKTIPIKFLPSGRVSRPATSRREEIVKQHVEAAKKDLGLLIGYNYSIAVILTSRMNNQTFDRVNTPRRTSSVKRRISHSTNCK